MIIMPHILHCIFNRKKTNEMILLPSRKYFLLTIIFHLSINSLSYSQIQIDTQDETEQRPSELGIEETTSLIRLIATPEKFDGERIQIIGYLHLEFEGNAIYLHKEDYDNCITENAFWVDFSERLTEKIKISGYSDNYVIIIGTFRMHKKGHLGLFSGTIENIVRLDNWCTWRKNK